MSKRALTENEAEAVGLCIVQGPAVDWETLFKNWAAEGK
jgi:hypothetical protein